MVPNDARKIIAFSMKNHEKTITAENPPEAEQIFRLDEKLITFVKSLALPSCLASALDSAPIRSRSPLEENAGKYCQCCISLCPCSVTCLLPPCGVWCLCCLGWSSLRSPATKTSAPCLCPLPRGLGLRLHSTP